MAKVIVRQATKDDPIYTGRFIISSPNKRPTVTSDKKVDEEVTVKSEEAKNNDS